MGFRPASAKRMERTASPTHLAQLGKQQRIFVLFSLDTQTPLGVSLVLHLPNSSLEQLSQEHPLLRRENARSCCTSTIRSCDGALLLLLEDGEDSVSETKDSGSGIVVGVGEEAEEEGKEGGSEGEGCDLGFCCRSSLRRITKREYAYKSQSVYRHCRLTSSMILQHSSPAPFNSFASFSRNFSTSSELSLVLPFSRPTSINRPKTVPTSNTPSNASLSEAGIPFETVSSRASAVAVRMGKSAGEGR